MEGGRKWEEMRKRKGAKKGRRETDEGRKRREREEER